MTGRATEGGAKFESGSRGGAEKESGWSSGWGLCRKIYLFVRSDPTGGPCQLWLLGAHTSILCGWQLCPWLALTSLLCSPTDSCSPVWPICHFVCSEPSFVLEALCLVPYGCFCCSLDGISQLVFGFGFVLFSLSLINRVLLTYLNGGLKCFLPRNMNRSCCSFFFFFPFLVLLARVSFSLEFLSTVLYLPR